MKAAVAETLDREWGKETILNRTDIHCSKLLVMRAGTRGGLQYHAKEESHYVLRGKILVRWDEGDGALREETVNAGYGWTMPPFMVHQEYAITDCTLIEVSDPFSADRVRVEKSYNMPEGGGLPSMSAHDAIVKLRGFAAALRNRADECEHRANHIQEHGLPLI